MTIEKITHFSHGVFAMLVFKGKPNEMTFASEAEAIGYVAAFNKMVAA